MFAASSSVKTYTPLDCSVGDCAKRAKLCVFPCIARAFDEMIHSTSITAGQTETKDKCINLQQRPHGMQE